jgi:hypothetical protein
MLSPDGEPADYEKGAVGKSSGRSTWISDPRVRNLVLRGRLRT